MSRFTTTNPTTGEALGEYERLSDDALESVVSNAQDGFSSWSRLPLQARTSHLHEIARLYRERADGLAYDMAVEMGKPLAQALGEVETVASIYEYYAENAETMLEVQEISVKGSGTASIRREPIGVILAIMPWNFPHYQVARIVAPNLALGNTIILKHATVCAKSAINIAELLQDSGLANGVFNNVFATHEQIEELIGDSRIKGVSLTGSDGAGERIGGLAGQHIKPAVLELGGSDPFIVLDDADLNKAARDAVVARCNNAGQQCTGGKRFIVHDAVYDEFMQLFLEGMKKVVVGDPLEASTRMGPLSSESALAVLEEQVAQAVEDGAKVLYGGNRLDRTGNFYQPTVLADVEPGNRAYYQELFGPVAMVFRVNSFSEAVSLANDSPYGLSAAVYTTSPEVAEDTAAQLETGMVYINTPSKSAAELPFGGVKRSGVGRELGTLGIEEFANRKLVRRS